MILIVKSSPVLHYHRIGRLVAGHLVAPLGLAALLGITSPDNHASIALLNKIGLRFTEQRLMPPDQRPTNLYRIALAPPTD